MYNFSLDGKHEKFNWDRNEQAVLNENNIESSIKGSRNLLQIVFNMTAAISVRLHVFEFDDPKEIAMRFMIFLLHKGLVHLTERKNIELFRKSIQNFIQSELEKVGCEKKSDT